MTVLATVAPVIDRTNLENITVRAGQMIKFDCNVTGEPIPKKTWFINKARQDNDQPGIKIDEEDHRTKIVIASCTRAHNGTFVIKADNTAGHDEVTIEVIVLGKSLSLSPRAQYWIMAVLYSNLKQSRTGMIKFFCAA